MKESSKCHLIVAGTQKAGTTWLHNTLEYQNEFWCPYENQEIHYFDKLYEKGYKYYEEKYKRASKRKITFDVTPDYLCHPLVPYRIEGYKRVSKRPIKIIAILRNPIERAISAYKMKFRKGIYSIPLSKAIKVDKSIVNKSKYLKPIKKYKRIFEKDFKVFIKEVVFEGTGEFLLEIEKFVNADEPIEDVYSGSKVNATSGRGGGKRYVRVVSKVLRFLGAEKIIHEVKRSDWSKYLREKRPSERKPIIDEKGVDELREELSDEVKAVGSLPGVPDMSSAWDFE